MKLCPHRHPNPRNAEICSQCGSRELSTPHPRIPLWLVPILAVLSSLPGVLLWLVTILFFFGLVNALVSSPELLSQLMLVGLMLGFLWYLYLHLPHFLRRFISRLFHRNSNRDDHAH